MRLIHSAFLVLVLSVVVVAGCGEQPVEDSAEAPSSSSPDTLHLAVTDTIGVDMGDSSYVFALLIEAGYSPDGRIMALDAQKCCVSVYSPDGSHLYDIGRNGAGPGEFQFPLSMAILSDGGLAVSDVLNAGLSFFDADGGYSEQLTGFVMGPPSSICPGPNGSFYGELMTMNMEDGEMEGSLDVARWDSLESPEPSAIYVSLPISIHAAGEEASVTRTVSVDFAVDEEGNLFIAEVSDTLFNITGYSPDGETILQLFEAHERVSKSQEELDAGDLGLSVTISDGCASASSFRSDDVYQWRNIIESIGVDGQGRIWVEMGDLEQPTFRIYDYSGELVAVAEVDADFGRIGTPTFSISPWGMLAYDRDPLDWPKIYLLDILEDTE